MNRSSKAAVIALFLLTTNAQMIQCAPSSGWQVFITFLFGNQQPQNNPDQIPAGVTTAHYIAQVISELKGLPTNDILRIEQLLKQELHLNDIQNPDLANQKTRSCLVSYVKTDTIFDLIELKKEGYNITSEDYQTIAQSYENNMIARLSRMPNLNGLEIAQYFGEPRKTALRDMLNKQQTPY